MLINIGAIMRKVELKPSIDRVRAEWGARAVLRKLAESFKEPKET